MVMFAGIKAIVTLAFKEVYEHVVDYEESYTHYFKSFPVFGGYFLSQMHKGFQLFLHSCAFRTTERMDFEAINFEPLPDLT